MRGSSCYKLHPARLSPVNDEKVSRSSTANPQLLPPMWRRSYLLLLFLRLYFALSPSYLHPDENFQGPEVIAGKIED